MISQTSSKGSLNFLRQQNVKQTLILRLEHIDLNKIYLSSDTSTDGSGHVRPAKTQIN